MYKKIGLIIFCFLTFIFAENNQVPGNSSTVIEIDWTRNSTPQEFYWAPAPSSVGIAGYFVYWGKNPNGEDNYAWVSSPQYQPPLCDHNLDGDAMDLEDTGTWYLRIKAVDRLGHTGDWHTVVTYQYDGVAPDLSNIPAKVEEVTAELPTKITWPAADDASGIGVNRYLTSWEYYNKYLEKWIKISSQQTVYYNTYDNPLFRNYGKYRLRVQAIDISENQSDWRTVYVCDYLEKLEGPGTSSEIKKVFTKSGEFQIPSGDGNPSKIVLTEITAVGGGGGGGKGSATKGGGGGGGAEIKLLFTEQEVAANTKINITVGTGGSGGQNSDGSDGNPSKITNSNGTIIEAAGGQSGKQNGSGGQQYVPGGSSGSQGTYSDHNGHFFQGGSGGNNAGGGGGGGGYISEPTEDNNKAKKGSGTHPGGAGQGYGAGGGGGDKNKGGGKGANGYVSFTVKYYYESNVQPVAVLGQSAWTNQAQPEVITWEQPTDFPINQQLQNNSFMHSDFLPHNESVLNNLTQNRYPIKGYNVSWGSYENSSYGTFQRSTSFTPPRCEYAGTYYLRVQAVDIHNNQSEWRTIYTYNFDDQAPAKSPTNFTIPWNNSADNKGNPLEWDPSTDSLSGIEGYQVYFGQNPQGTSTNFVVSPQQAINCEASTKNYYLRVRAKDRAGNYGQWQTVYTYFFDNIPPKEVTTKKFVDWTKNPNPGEITWEQGVDYGGSGLAGYHIYWGTDSQGTSTTKITETRYSPASCLSVGVYYLRVQVVDHAGNTSGWQDVLTYRFDNQAPAKSITNEVEGWTNVTDRVAFTWVASDDNGGSGVKQYRIYWGNKPLAEEANQATVVTNSFDPPAIPSGLHIYYLRIQPIDRVGNSGQWQTVLTYKFNDQVPSGVKDFNLINWTNTAQYQNNQGTNLYSWSVPNKASGQPVKDYRVYWGTEAQGTSNTQINVNSYPIPACVESKTHYLRVQTLDLEGGNLEGPWSTILIYKYDNKAPELQVTTQEKGWFNKDSHKSFDFEWNPAIDDGAGFQRYKVYWGVEADSTLANKNDIIFHHYFLPLKIESSGIYHLRVKPIDKISNEGQWQTVLTYKYDQDIPYFSESVNNGSSKPTSSPKAPIQQWPAAQDDLSGIAGYEVYWGTKNNDFTGIFQESNKFDPPTCNEGTTHYLWIRAKDCAGNFGEWKRVYTYNYDRLAPIHFHQAVTGDWTTNPNPGTITWTEAEDNGVSGLSHYCIYWGPDADGQNDDQIVAKNEYAPTDVCQKSGFYYLRVKLVDNAGNESDWQTYYTYRYDQQAPVMDFKMSTINWTAQKDPENIVWPQADETNGSGLKGYYVYWGENADGTKEDNLQIANSFDPPACDKNATFYLRIKAVDQLDNASQWQTFLVYQYDDIAPEGISTKVSQNWTVQADPNTLDGYFQWQKPADNCCGVAYYYWYWGQDPQGIAFEMTEENKLHLPPCDSAGTYYLRIMPVDFADNRGQWQTIYQYQFDNLAPEELPKLKINDWSNVADCSLYQWNVTDNHSGIQGNYIYWGTDPQGEGTVFSESFEYDPPICTESGHYYFRIKAVDKLDNIGQWHTIFIYRYDNIAPQATETSITTEWTKNPQPNKVSWLPASDTGGSEIAGYNLYWGTDPAGEKIDNKVSDCQYLPPKCLASSIHYLRIQTVDTAGNTANWQTVLTYRYDCQPPKNTSLPQNIGWTNITNPAIWQLEDWDEVGGSGVAYYQMMVKGPKNNSEIIKTTKSQYQISNIEESGEYGLWVKATDVLGNESMWKNVLIYKYDNIAPTDTSDRTTSDWTTNVDCPRIEWQLPEDNISGIAGHYIYWGKDPEGEDDKIFITDNSYDPPICEQQGIHYLRVLSKDGAGNTGRWTTVHAYRFASEPPGEIPAVISAWSNNPDCSTITWQSANDLGGSGIKGYDLYWGIEENGTKEDNFQTENSYDPPVCTENKFYYLRLRPHDNAGHIGSWQTVFTYRYETIAPGSSSSPQVQHDWSNDPQPQIVQWKKAPDFGGSEIGGYQVYWGQQENGEEITAEIQDCQYQPAECIAAGKYYLRIRPFDNAGNLGQWQTIIIYRYDNLVPEKIDTQVISDWTNQMDPDLIKWNVPKDQGDSGIAGYNFYWGTDSEGIAETKIDVNRYDPPQCKQAVTHYLRVRAYDYAGNHAQWQTVYTYRLSTQVPENSQTEVIEEGWTNVADRDVFTWEAVANSISGIAGYYVYWGREVQGTADSILSENSFDPPRCEQTGIYYLRIKPIDKASNQGAWQTVLIYKYTDQKPGASPTYLEKPWTNQEVVGKVTWDVAEDLGDYGIAGYFIYWGQEPQGTKDEFITTANYTPANCDQQGVYYLRICPVNKPGNSGQWQTVLRYAYEVTKPEFTVSEIINQAWTNVSQAPKVDWPEATDSGGSQLKGYNIYWGTKPAQAKAEFFTPTTNWLPLACTLDAKYHLLVQAVDQAGNTSEWQQVLTYEYDGQAPPLSASAEIGDWTKEADCPQFSWQEVVDNVGSGFKSYQVRWVTDNSSTETGIFSVVNSFDPPACQHSGIYYLQVRSVDNVGNISAWQNVLTYRYDQDLPELVMVDPLPKDNITKKQKFVFKILDNLSGIDQDSLTVEVNDALAVKESMEAIASGYLVTVKSPTDFTNDQEVRLKVCVADNLKNLLVQELSFQVAQDQTPPEIKNTTVTFDTNNPRLSFEIIEKDSEIVKNSITVLINSTRYTAESPTVKCTEIANGYLLTVDASAFAGEPVVNVLVQATNTSGYGKSYSEMYSNGGSQEQPAQPQEDDNIVRSNGGTGEQIYSYPNPFKASKQTELMIVFEAKKQESLEIFVYNIRGQIVWRTTAEAEAGRNTVKWDGQDAFGRRLANGVYFLFVVNSEKKVVYKGRMCAVD